MLNFRHVEFHVFNFQAKLQSFKKKKKKEEKRKKNLDLKNIEGNIRVCLNIALPLAATLTFNIKKKETIIFNNS